VIPKMGATNKKKIETGTRQKEKMSAKKVRGKKERKRGGTNCQ